MRVVLVGAGAQAKYALENLRFEPRLEVAGLIDLLGSAGSRPEELLGQPVLGGLEDLPQLARQGIGGAIACCASGGRKAELHAAIRELGLEMPNAVHPRAVVADSARVAVGGVIINAGAVVQPFARIGRGVMIHANVVVEHDNVIEDFANLAPGVSLAGWVTVKTGAVVGTGAAVIPRVTIGRGAVIGAGAVVLADVADGVTVAGVPARVIASTREVDE